MAYRDFEGALLAQRRMLIEEIERLDAERARFQSNLRHRDQLAARLRELDRRTEASDPEPSDFLEGLRVASPCSARWDEMIGDDPRVRFCPSCAKNVYDLSSLTEDEVTELVTETEGRLCGRLRKRRDGSVISGDCPVGLRRKRRLGLAAAAAAAVGATAGASLQAGEVQPTRSLLLAVKYVDRVGTQVEERIDPSYRPRASCRFEVMGEMDRDIELVDRGRRAKKRRSPR